MIDVVGDTPMTLTTLEDDAVEIVATQTPTTVTDTTPEQVVIEVMQGLPGDDRVYAGATPPDNPQEGWIWINTSG